MKVRVGLTAAGVVLGLAGPLATAAAAPSVASDGAAQVSTAGWGAHHACLVLSRKEVQCFATVAAMLTRSNQLLAVGSISCPLTLYTGSNYTGQALELTGQGYWMNLSDYGFDNATVSFIENGCGFHLAQEYWGGGYWYPGYTGHGPIAWTWVQVGKTPCHRCTSTRQM